MDGLQDWEQIERANEWIQRIGSEFKRWQVGSEIEREEDWIDKKWI